MTSLNERISRRIDLAEQDSGRLLLKNNQCSCVVVNNNYNININIKVEFQRDNIQPCCPVFSNSGHAGEHQHATVSSWTDDNQLVRMLMIPMFARTFTHMLSVSVSLCRPLSLSLSLFFFFFSIDLFSLSLSLSFSLSFSLSLPRPVTVSTSNTVGPYPVSTLCDDVRASTDVSERCVVRILLATFVFYITHGEGGEDRGLLQALPTGYQVSKTYYFLYFHTIVVSTGP